MTDLPEKLDIVYLMKMTPPQQSAAAVARAVNQIIDYLSERGLALEAFAKPIDEILDTKLGPHPDSDPELKKRV